MWQIIYSENWVSNDGIAPYQSAKPYMFLCRDSACWSLWTSIQAAEEGQVPTLCIVLNLAWTITLWWLQIQFLIEFSNTKCRIAYFYVIFWNILTTGLIFGQKQVQNCHCSILFWLHWNQCGNARNKYMQAFVWSSGTWYNLKWFIVCS